MVLNQRYISRYLLQTSKIQKDATECYIIFDFSISIDKENEPF
jgi:hypothetical protein